MKYLVLLFAGLLSLAVACTHHRPDGLFKWEPVDSEFDSVAEILDIERLKMDIRISADMDSLRAIYIRSQKHDALRGRMAFWEAFNQFWVCHDVDSALIYLSKAAELTDSAKRPYDWARIKFGRGINQEMSLYSRYCDVVECREVFELYGDSIYTALCDNELGNIMGRIGNYPLSYEYMQRALEVFKHLEIGYVVPRLKMNIALILYEMGRQRDADILIDEVLGDSVMYVNPALENLMFMSKYLISKDTAYLMDAYQIVSKRPYAMDFHISESVCMGNMFISENKLDSAAGYVRFAYSHIGEVDNLEDKRDIVLARLNYLIHRNKDIDELKAWNTLCMLLDSIEKEATAENILNAETRNKIAVYKADEVRKEERNRTVMWITVLLCIIVALCVVLIALYYRNRLLNEKREVEVRLRRNRETMAAVKLQQDTTRNVLEKFENEINHTAGSPEHIPDSLQWLRKQIKLYKAQEASWAAVLETFDQVHPDFEAKMLRSYPSLTRKQVEFAGYIALGLTSKQIAELLGIDAASVNTNRYRLRTKMRLDKGESLEDAILNIIGQ